MTTKIAVVGMGYVGVPIAALLALDQLTQVFFVLCIIPPADHRTELEQIEGSASLANALMPENHRSAGIKLDGHSDGRQNWG